MIFTPDLTTITPQIVNFIIGVTQQCNFRCKYCCFSGEYPKMRTHNNNSITKESIEQTIRFIQNYAIKEQTIYVSFYGGEALLKLDLIEKTANRLIDIFGDRVEFDISTNGWLLTLPVIKRILKIPRAAISVSIDGIKEIHDKNRLHVTGKPTYDRVTQNLRKFKELFPDEYNKRIRILMTMESLADISKSDEQYDSIKEMLGDRNLLISRIMPNFEKNLLYKDSLNEKLYFMRCASNYERKGLSNLHVKILKQLRKKAKPTFKGDVKKLNLHVCLNKISSCFISTEGKIFPCEKLNQEFEIGDIWNGFDNAKIRKIILQYTLRRNLLCKTCAYIRNCHRCITDLNFNIDEHKVMCSDYKENIELCHKFREPNETIF